jgi:hypothetical protein
MKYDASRVASIPARDVITSAWPAAFVRRDVVRK